MSSFYLKATLENLKKYSIMFNIIVPLKKLKILFKWSLVYLNLHLNPKSWGIYILAMSSFPLKTTLDHL